MSRKNKRYSKELKLEAVQSYDNAMMLFGVNNYKNNNSEFSELFDAGEFVDEKSDIVQYHRWLDLEGIIRDKEPDGH